IFDQNLDYLCSWEDSNPARPITADIADIFCYPSGSNFLITYPWGFYAYATQNTLAGISLSQDYLYPGLVGWEYEGLEIDLHAVGRGGRLDIKATANGETYNIVEDYYLGKNQSFSNIWDGNDKTGSDVPYGSYQIEFYLNNQLVDTQNLQIKSAPEITVNDPGTYVINHSSPQIDYEFSVTGDSVLRISTISQDQLEPYGTLNILSESVISGGVYDFTLLQNQLGAIPADGYYNIYFDVAPIEFETVSNIYSRKSETFLLDTKPLELDSISNTMTGFNPNNSTIREMESTFNLSERAYITTRVLDENDDVVRVIKANQQVAPEEQTIQWDGNGNDGRRVADGQYRFSVSVSQPEAGENLSDIGASFILDTTAPVISFLNDQDVYYISPDEISSIDKQDNVTFEISSNEEALIDSSVTDSSSTVIKTLTTAETLYAGSSLTHTWNGDYSSGGYVPDGRYQVSFEAEDLFGNIATERLFVIVDNNRLIESSSEETAFESMLFQINTSGLNYVDYPYTPFNRESSTILSYDDGFVAVWINIYGYYDDHKIYAQRFDLAGNKQGDEIIISELYGTGMRHDRLFVNSPSIIKIDEGYIVTWLPILTNMSSVITATVEAQRFDENWNKLGGKFLIHGSFGPSDLSNYSICEISDGFAVVWESSINGIAEVQTFDNLGNPISGVDRVNNISSGNIVDFNTEIIAIGNGFVISWQDYDQYGNYCVFAQRYDGNGNPLGSKIQVNSAETYSATTISSSLADTSDGFIINWGSPDGEGISLYTKRYDNSGLPIGNEIKVNAVEDLVYSSGITEYKGGYIVTWLTGIAEEGPFNVYTQKIDVNGIPSENVIRIGEINDITSLELDLAEFGDEDLIMSWLSSADDILNVKKIELFEIPQGTNLTAEFLSPSTEGYVAGGNFSIKGIASDTYIDYYVLSIQSADDEPRILSEINGINKKGDLFNFNILDAAEGVPNTVRLEAWDKAGNKRSDEFILTREYESIINSLTISDDFVSEIEPLKVSFDLETECDVTLDIGDVTGNIVQTQNLGNLKSEEEFQLSTTGLADGSYDLVISTSHDTFSAEEHSVSFTLDNTSPTISITDFDKYINTEDDIILNFVVTEENTKNISVSLIGGDNFNKELSDSADPESFQSISIDPTRYAEGDYQLQVFAIDKAGNTAVSNHDIIFDITAPQVVFNSPAAGQVVHGNTAIDLEMTDDSEFDSYSLYYINTQGAMVDISDQSDFSDGNITVNWDSASVGNGIHNGNLAVVVRDKAGNVTTADTSIVIDNNAPVSSIIFTDEPFLNNGNQYISGTNEIYFTAVPDDIHSTVSSIQYSTDGGSLWTDFSGPLVLSESGNYNILYRAIDNLNNIEEANSYSISVDTAAPDASCLISEPVYSSNGDTFIAYESLFTITGTDSESGIRSIKYNLGDSNWISYTDEFNLLKDGEIDLSYKATDNVGNETETYYGPLFIDLAPPQTFYSIDKPYYESHQRNIIALKEASELTLTSIDPLTDGKSSGLEATYIVENEDQRIYDQPFTISDEIPVEYEFYAVDNIGNTEASTPMMIAVDSLAPVVNVQFSKVAYTDDETVYTTSGSVLSLTAEDNFAGVKAIRTSLNGEEFIEEADDFSWDEETELTLAYYAEDNLGWASDAEVLNISIDDTAPVTFMSSNMSLVDIDGELYADSRYEFTFQSADAKSGVSETIVEIDGELKSEFPFIFREEGTHIINYYSIDNLGNTEVTKSEVIITPIPDITPPVTSLVTSVEPYSADGMDYYTSDTRISFTAEDILGQFDSYASGVQSVYYSLDGITFLEYTEGAYIQLEDEGRHIITYYAVDEVGNIEADNYYELTIDNSSPETILAFDRDTHLEIDDSLYIYESEKIAFISADTYSGVNNTYFRISDDAPWTEFTSAFELPSGTYSLQWYSKDNLDNTEMVQIQNLTVDTKYNVLSHKTTVIPGDFENVEGYVIANDNIMYLKGTGESHIYIKDLESEPGVIFSKSTKLSAKKADRIDIQAGTDFILTVEKEGYDQNIFLYTTDETHQNGRMLSNYGINRDLIIQSDKLYWTYETGYSTAIVCYDLTEDYSEILYETSNQINSLKINGDSISFIESDDDSQSIMELGEGDIKKIYISSRNMYEILDYSFNGDVLILETSDPEHPVSVIHNLEDPRKLLKMNFSILLQKKVKIF
ncbi:MAG: hypothetical protein JEY91_10620, partial [Spirochaetaceae bacterium]|nr:hypothetical protein [Spirochaetaceae bacterium]